MTTRSPGDGVSRKAPSGRVVGFIGVVDGEPLRVVDDGSLDGSPEVRAWIAAMAASEDRLDRALAVAFDAINRGAAGGAGSAGASGGRA